MAKVVVDATEYGDIMPLAGVRYRIGNGLSEAPVPDACVQFITYTTIVKKYPAGIPAACK